MTAICQWCGQEWTRHPALARALGEVECPKCGADVGLGCRRPSDHAGPFVEPHIEREQLAMDRKLLGMCSKGPTAKQQRTQPALLDTV